MGSEGLFREALCFIPGGVNSPVRAFKAVGGVPLFISRGKGSRVWDVEGREYIDYVGSWGPLILGHAHPRVVEALREQVGLGTSFGAPTQVELELCKLLVEAVPSVEKVRLTNSGTEAAMSAIRLARAFTGRKKVLKFEGCYHGHVDGLLVKAGSGAMTFGVPDSPGVPQEYAGLTVVVPYNDLQAVDEAFRTHKGEIACVIVEPVAGNMGVVLPEKGFLEGLREICSRDGALLVFDEVITGFRLGWSGAQGLFGVMPDLTCLGKIIGGGLPIGAFGGRAEVMDLLSPSGPVYQAGTLSGNPLSVRAGLETLMVLKETMPYGDLEALGKRLALGLQGLFFEKGIPVTINQIGSMLTVFFTEGPVTDFESAKKSDTRLFSAFFHALLKRGVYIPPSQFESWFLSLAHTEGDVSLTLDLVKEALKEI